MASTSSTIHQLLTNLLHLPKTRALQLSVSLLFFLNFLYLLTYFHHHHATSPPPPLSSLLHRTTTKTLSPPRHPHRHRHLHPSTSSKPWPNLPSYLPWTPPSNSSSSCESFFGNAFSRTSFILPRTSSASWFGCRYNAGLRSSVCDGGRVLMDPSKIRMSDGGEKIDEVIGRSDEEELPVFLPGSFRLRRREGEEETSPKRVVSEAFLDQFVPHGQISRHTMRELFANMELVGKRDFNCNEWIEEPTLLVTRFEYANVFHTYTDWYSSYVSSRVTGLPTRPNVVFLDGHARTQLEETWEALFSSIRFAKNFTGPVCFRHAVFVPLGYETAWFKGLSEPIQCQGASAQDLWANPDDSKTARLSEFGELVKSAFDLPVERLRTVKPSLEYNVLFVRREDYLAHPRHGGRVESRLSNEQEVFDSLKTWASNHTDCRVNLVNGLFAHMSMREQIRAIEDANVIIGAHGAGLTHVVSASPKTVILEIISSQFQRPHFQLISKWKGLDYHAINLPASSADPEEVIGRLKKIMKSIGC
ncbi:beta-1,2-xylosyltransferase-like [Silene latifolia]|uniref:beta-1,2-xylosyltransferase-like n=1 Tax=Silene latifolia TaxID=37657 RepID=UPI003D77AC2D